LMLLNIGSILFFFVFRWIYCYMYFSSKLQTRNSVINKILFYCTFPIYRQTGNKPQNSGRLCDYFFICSWRGMKQEVYWLAFVFFYSIASSYAILTRCPLGVQSLYMQV
jgi:hypothetical protein